MKPLTSWGRNLDSMIRQEKEKLNKIKSENETLEAKQKPKAKKSAPPPPNAAPVKEVRPFF